MKATSLSTYSKAVLAIASVILALPKNAEAQRPLGVDVSSYQGGSVNWVSNKLAGISFGWAKATEGTIPQGYHVDADFTINMNGAKNAGIYIGAYHFSHPEIDTADAEAAFFWSTAGNYIKADGLSFSPMLDMEVFTGITGASSYSAWVNNWCNDIVSNGAAQGVKIKPSIYISACHANQLDTSVAQWFSDIANYSGNSPQTSTPWTACGSAAYEVWGTGVWHVWQYNDTSTLPGYPVKQPDVDVYNGTLAQMVAAMVCTSTGPNVTSQTANTNVVPGANATLSVTATGTGPVHYQWAFNNVNISGATNSNYTVTNVQAAKAGGYTVKLTDNTAATTTNSGIYVGLLLPLTNGPASVVVPAGLVDWWTGDGNPTDLFGPNDASPRGVLTYVAGESGMAMHFDGSSTMLTTMAADLAVPWTASAWVNRQNTPQTSAGLFENGNNSLKIEQYPTTHKLGLSVLGVGDYIFGSGTIVPVGVWTHVAFVGTTAGVSCYMNGTLVGTLTNTFSLPRTYIGGAFYAGSGQYLDLMSGNMDDIMVFNRALTVAQIQSIYSAGTSGLVRAPQIVSSSMLSSGFNLKMRGLTGKNFSIYTSPDLTNWTLLTGLVNSTGSNQITDPTVTNKMFYRVSQQY